MKVKLEDGYKSRYTIEDLERAKMLIACAKDDEATAKDHAEYAVREALRGTGDFLSEVIKASAHTAKNYRAYDAYTDGSGNMDIWIEATAETIDGFVKVGAYLTDIWAIDGENNIREHMWIKHYIEDRS